MNKRKWNLLIAFPSQKITPRRCWRTAKTIEITSRQRKKNSRNLWTISRNSGSSWSKKYKSMSMKGIRRISIRVLSRAGSTGKTRSRTSPPSRSSNETMRRRAVLRKKWCINDTWNLYVFKYKLSNNYKCRHSKNSPKSTGMSKETLLWLCAQSRSWVAMRWWGMTPQWLTNFICMKIISPGLGIWLHSATWFLFGSTITPLKK